MPFLFARDLPGSRTSSSDSAVEFCTSDLKGEKRVSENKSVHIARQLACLLANADASILYASFGVP